MAMLALAIGGDTISNEARREAIIDGLFDLPSKYSASLYNISLGCSLFFKELGQWSESNSSFYLFCFCRQSQRGVEA